MSLYINGVEQVVIHAASHQDTGVDEISVAALSGELADRQLSKVGTSVLGWTNLKLLRGAGAGSNPTEIDVPSGAKELFIPVTYAGDGATMDRSYYFPCAALSLSTHGGYMGFFVPNDFTSIISAVIVVMPRATQAAADWNIKGNYFANGQARDTHVEEDLVTTYNVTNQVCYEVDISGILSVLAANDYVGVTLVQGTDGHNVDVLGIRLRYS